MPSDRRTVCV